MGEIGNEHKVRCHKGAVENLAPRRRYLKIVPAPSVPAFPAISLRAMFILHSRPISARGPFKPPFGLSGGVPIRR